MVTRSSVLDFVAILATALVVIGGLSYAYVVYEYNLQTLVLSVVLPLVLGTAILSVRRKKVLVFAYLAYIWAIVDDAPVYFDSVLTWPEVTRFHPFLPRLIMNIVIHVLTLFFMYAAVSSAGRRGKDNRSEPLLRNFRVVILTLVAFVLAYAQNIPINIIQSAVDHSWYSFDVVSKLLSIVFLYLAIRLAGKQGIVQTESAVSSSR